MANDTCPKVFGNVSKDTLLCEHCRTTNIIPHKQNAAAVKIWSHIIVHIIVPSQSFKMSGVTTVNDASKLEKSLMILMRWTEL